MAPENEGDVDNLEKLDFEEINGPDEIEEVLTGLRTLLNRVSHPVVRACLEETLAEVAHLTSRDDGSNDSDEREVA
jgi:hypothetical protein